MYVIGHNNKVAHVVLHAVEMQHAVSINLAAFLVARAHRLRIHDLNRR